MEIKFYFKQLINAIKAARKHALYAESRFLYNLNRKIQITDYQKLLRAPAGGRVGAGWVAVAGREGGGEGGPGGGWGWSGGRGWHGSRRR